MQDQKPSRASSLRRENNSESVVEIVVAIPAPSLVPEIVPEKRGVQCYVGLLKESFWRVFGNGAFSEARLYARARQQSLSNVDIHTSLRLNHKVAKGLKSYDPNFPLLTLRHFHGTALKLVLMRLEFWLLLALHVALSLLYFRAGTGGGGSGSAGGEKAADIVRGWPKLSVTTIALPGTLLALLLTFYLNQTFSRYQTQALHVCAASGDVGDLLLLFRAHFRDDRWPEARALRLQMWKYTNAFHMLAYAGLPQSREQHIDKWAWAFLLDKQLLTRREVELVRPLMDMAQGKLAYRECVTWVELSIWEQVHSKRMTDKIASQMTKTLLDARKSLEALHSYTAIPIPFAYYHLLNGVLLLYLAMLAYALVFVAPYWSAVAFAWILLGLLGIRELGNAMSNPFGCDEVDLPVFDMVVDVYEESLALMDITPNNYALIHADS